MSSSVCGSLSIGSLTSLLANQGVMDQYLTGKNEDGSGPSVTFWRGRYNKHSNFSLETIRNQFAVAPRFGGESHCTLTRAGDLIHNLMAVVTLPGICASDQATSGFTVNFPEVSQVADFCDPAGDGQDPSCICNPDDDEGNMAMPDVDANVDFCTGLKRPFANWVNAVGYAVLEQVTLSIGGSPVDTVWSELMYILEELNGSPGKRLTEMIGKRYSIEQAIEDSRKQRTLYVPIPFWFTKSSGLALPMVALQFHGVQVSCKWAPLNKLIQVSTGTKSVLDITNNTPLTIDSLQATLDVQYVFLETTERDRFSVGEYNQLIVQHQRYQPTDFDTSNVNIQLNFNHPIIALYFAARREANSQKNNTYNFSGKYGYDPVNNVGLLLNNLARWNSQLEARYFRLVQPYQHCTNIPAAHIYMFSFALDTAQAYVQPSGSCNFSRIDTVHLQMKMQEGLGKFTLFVYAQNYNVLQFSSGLAGVRFAN